ncbi:MAG: hypothetical protein GTO29_07530 [Candidatus Latescibacteria bacterium]|nr:hypothetical protein [Candidatus Latescibacterota bacterium]NIO55934.1 hypothetical protein [Candidatus Latescibacterota bacterium]
MSGDKITVGTIGLGPVGAVVGACLAKAGAEIVATDLPHRISQLEKSGIQVYWDNELLQYAVRTADSIRAMADARPYCMIIATKASILKQIMPEVAEAAGDHCLVISTQNGIGTEDEIARYVPPENVCRMVVNFAGGIDAQGVVRVGWFNPPNCFGLIEEREEPRLTTIIDMLNSAGLTSELVSPFTIKKKAFLKTVLNASLLPLCAVMELTMKQAMQGKATRPLVEKLVREGLSVAERLEYDYGEDIFEQCMGYLDKGGDHHPSMTVDLQCKLPTEIDFINGKILEIGHSFGDLDLETHRFFVSLLMTAEVKNGTREPDDFPEYLLNP